MRYGHAPSGQWEWQDEHGKWSAYSPAVQRLLGACQTCGVSEWKIEAMGRQYKVEIGAGPSGLSVQTNVETGVQRKVRHSGADDSTGISKSYPLFEVPMEFHRVQSYSDCHPLIVFILQEYVDRNFNTLLG